VTDERRWVDRDDVPDDVAGLLRGATKARPIDPATLARSRRRIAALGAVPIAAGSLFWMNAAFGAALGAVVTTVAVVVPHYTSPSAVPASSAHRARAPSPPVAPAAGASLAPLPDHPMDEAAIAAPLASAPAPPRAPGAAASGPRVDRAVAAPSAQHGSAAPDAGGDLAREADLLERARVIAPSDPGGALVVLSQHERAFPRGSLVLERELLAVDALLRLGRRADAEARARSLRARAPGSLYTRRLEHLLGGAP
jgi:hypothetical protein